MKDGRRVLFIDAQTQHHDLTIRALQGQYAVTAVGAPPSITPDCDLVVISAENYTRAVEMAEQVMAWGIPVAIWVGASLEAWQVRELFRTSLLVADVYPKLVLTANDRLAATRDAFDSQR